MLASQPGSGEGPGAIGLDTPLAGDDTSGNDTPPTADDGETTPVDDPGPSVEEPPVGAEPDASLIGFASVAAAGLDTTTGGDGGEVVTVTTFEDLEQISSPGARIVQVQGAIASPDEAYVKLRVGSNESIIGLGADAALEHIGFDVTGWGDAETGALADFCEPESWGSSLPSPTSSSATRPFATRSAAAATPMPSWCSAMPTTCGSTTTSFRACPLRG